MIDLPVSDFAYVGGRPYIRGVDLIGFYLEHTPQDRSDRPVEIRSLRLSRELERNGVWTDPDDSAIAPGGPGPSAVLDYVDGIGGNRRKVFVETGRRIVRTSPDVPSLVSGRAMSGPFAGRASLVPPVDFMVLLGGLVEANKALHAATIKEQGLDPGSIRFVYVERLPVPAVAQPGPVGLDIVHRGAREKDGRVYTLNVAEAGLHSGPARTTICFSYDKE